MEKYVQFSTKNERGVFLFDLASKMDQGYLSKTASASEYHPVIAEYVKNAAPIDGVMQLLVTAMGAGEYYGENKNGDYFPEDALREYCKTFESDGHIFKHHRNKYGKDPDYGVPALAVWNDRMKRVELILHLNKAKAPDIVARIEAGEYPDLSMGCRVPYDVCNCCGNKAKTTKEYCEHLKYYMRRVPPGHSKVAYAINLTPKFFDISFVTIGADSIAKTMKKVASVEGDAEAMEDTPKFASFARSFRKFSSIVKEVPSNLPVGGAIIDEHDTSLAPERKKVQSPVTDTETSLTADANSVAQTKTAFIGEAIEGLISRAIVRASKDKDFAANLAYPKKSLTYAEHHVAPAGQRAKKLEDELQFLANQGDIIIKVSSEKEASARGFLAKTLGAGALSYGTSGMVRAKAEADPYYQPNPISAMIADSPGTVPIAVAAEHLAGGPISGKVEKALGWVRKNPLWKK